MTTILINISLPSVECVLMYTFTTCIRKLRVLYHNETCKTVIWWRLIAISVRKSNKDIWVETSCIVFHLMHYILFSLLALAVYQ